MAKFVIPAIDIQDGKCVRLTKGELEQKTIYYEDPLDALRYWESQGTEWIHIVDLDGAFGIGTNFELVERMAKNTNLNIEMGGGIRDLKKAERLIELGVKRVVVGTSAVKDPDFVKELSDKLGKEKIVVALDEKDGKPAIKGWTETIDTDIFEIGKKMEEKGAGFILMSSVKSDGAFTGPDLTNTELMVKSVTIPVIAAGGVRGREDILELQKIGAAGVVVGKAFYENRLDYTAVKDLD